MPDSDSPNRQVLKAPVIIGNLQEGEQPESPTLLGYVRTLKRHKWLIVGCLASALIPAILFIKLSRPVYEASAAIIYEEPKDQIFDMDDVAGFYNQTAVMNLMGQLLSRSLAEEVVSHLPGFALQSYASHETWSADSRRDDGVVRELQKNLSISKVQMSDIVTIAVQANDPRSAKIIANTYVDRIIDWDLRKNRAAVAGVRRLVETQQSQFQARLNDAERALRVFREANRMISLDQTSNEHLRGWTEAEIAYNQVKAERVALQQRKNAIDQQIEDTVDSDMDSSSLIIQQLKHRLMQLEMEFSIREMRDKKNSKNLTSLRASIDQVKSKLIDELMKSVNQDNLLDPLSRSRNLLQEAVDLEVDVATYKARERGLKMICANYEAKLQKLPGQQLELAQLIREKDVNEKIYSMLLEKREEGRIKEAAKVGNVHVIDYAEEPAFAVKPSKKKYLALGLLAGLGLGVGLTVVLESFDNSLKSQEEVEKLLDLPVLGVIPTISAKNLKRKLDCGTDKAFDCRQFCYINRLSNVYEAYRALQINLASIQSEKALKAILVTSPGMSEGKTLTAVNLAQAFALNKARTLLIDCDLRRPVVYRLLAIELEPGLTNVLSHKYNATGGLSLEKAVRTMERQDLSFDVLPSGTLPTDPSEIEMLQNIHEVLSVAKENYEVIIIDSPPIIAVTDVRILSAKVDGICMVVRSGKTNRNAACKAKEILENRKAPFIGAIVNDIDLGSVYEYHKYYHYYSKNGGYDAGCEISQTPPVGIA